MESKKLQCSKVLLLLPMVAWLLLSFNVHSLNAQVEKHDPPTLNNPDNAGHAPNNNPELNNHVDGHYRRKRFGNGEIAGNIIRPFLPTYFGTKWCGDNPRETNDLKNIGLFTQTDRCCQEHYLCTENAKQYIEKKYPHSYTGVFRSCPCDDAFFRCLNGVQSVFSSRRHIIVGEDYFNVLAPRCLTESEPVVECVRYQNPNVPNSRCISYKLAVTEPKILVVMDNPSFEIVQTDSS